jgi:PTH1 family peptidyl-tRNA hydrolase
MTYTVVGLGNPGEEYEHTRHNIGRMVVERLADEWGTSDWRDDKKLRARIAKGASPKGTNVNLILPDNYMNRSGGAVAPLVKNAKQAERLVVVQDDIDLGLGTVRVVFNRGAGGHRGVASIEKAIKTRAFIRVRIGVIPTTPTGKLRKPRGEDKIYNFILKQLTKKEQTTIAKVVKHGAKVVAAIVEEGRDEAMREYNGVTTKV